MERADVKRLCSGLVLFALVACGSPDGPRTSSPPSAPAAESAPSAASRTGATATTGSALTLADADGCPVTEPVQAPADFAELLFGSSAAYGNGSMWVGGLGENGVILADPRLVESDGSIGWKFGWWRVEPGQVTITGRRLDGDAPPLRGEASDAYGDSGFQPSGVSFPTEGCWEVTGTIGDASLTFVTFVLPA